jgi:hypothetical protein
MTRILLAAVLSAGLVSIWIAHGWDVARCEADGGRYLNWRCVTADQLFGCTQAQQARAKTDECP